MSASLRAAFEAAGGKPPDKAEQEFYSACVKLIRAGKSREAGIAVLDFAFKNLGKGQTAGVTPGDQQAFSDARTPLAEGQAICVVNSDQPDTADGNFILGKGQHPCVADGDQIKVADAQNPIPGGGQNFPVANGDQNDVAPAGSPIADGEAIGGLPNKARSYVPSVREPSAADIEALKASGDFYYFQMINLRKKAWSTYRYKQLENVIWVNDQESLIATAVRQWGRDNKVKEDDLVALTMPAPVMKEIVRRAKNTIRSKAEFTPPKRNARHGR